MKKNKCPRMLLNSITGILASFITTFSLYCIRIIISHTLGQEIYGINSIFVSIVSTFLILELGMSTAMIITMYRPVAEDDREKIKSVLQLYKHFYWAFCSVLMVLGIIVDLFFLQSFVKTTLNFTYVRIYFLMYLFSIVFKYLWSYKSCLLYANKQNSIVSISTVIVTSLFTVLEVVSVTIWKAYFVYLVLFLLQNVTLNAVCNIYVNKHYTYVQDKNVVALDQESKKGVLEIIRPMFVQRIATQLQDASSLVVLGAIGTSAVVVGFFSNYILVVHACQTIFNQIGASFTTSFGSFSARVGEKKQQYEYYKTSRFCMSWVAVIFATMYLCLIQNFIELFFGKQYQMSLIIAVLFSVYVFVVLDSAVNLSIQNAVGAHYLDTKEMVIQSFLGIILSVILGRGFGAVGVVIGLLLSVGAFTWIVKGTKIYKQLFGVSGGKHVLLLMKETINFAVVSITSVFIYRKLLHPQGFLFFFLSAAAIFIFANVIMLLLNLFSPQLISLKNILRRS